MLDRHPPNYTINVYLYLSFTGSTTNSTSWMYTLMWFDMCRTVRTDRRGITYAQHWKPRGFVLVDTISVHNFETSSSTYYPRSPGSTDLSNSVRSWETPYFTRCYPGTSPSCLFIEVSSALHRIFNLEMSCDQLHCTRLGMIKGIDWTSLAEIDWSGWKTKNNVDSVYEFG